MQNRIIWTHIKNIINQDWDNNRRKGSFVHRTDITDENGCFVEKTIGKWNDFGYLYTIEKHR